MYRDYIHFTSRYKFTYAEMQQIRHNLAAYQFRRRDNRRLRFVCDNRSPMRGAVRVFPFFPILSAAAT